MGTRRARIALFLSLAAFGLCSGRSGVASATSEACVPLRVIDATPLAGERGVPRDARLAFEVSSDRCGGSIPVTATIVDDAGRPVAATQTTWDGRYFHAVRPNAPLAPNADYKLVVRSEEALVEQIPFVTGADLSPVTSAPIAPPTIAIRSMRWTSGPTDSSVGTYASALFEIVVRRPASSPLGIVHVQNDSERALPGTAFATSRSVFTRGKDEWVIEVGANLFPGQPRCLSAIYENEVGTRSASSADACFTATELPPAQASSDGSDGQGCAFAPGSTSSPLGSGLAIVAVAAVIRATRSRRGARERRA
ncbi:MAG: hypothetical protein JST00_37850 [Deltaproteobacteria bacterium]|nr:hypothetical protein [Deltaproteobacteria bacterium]